MFCHDISFREPIIHARHRLSRKTYAEQTTSQNSCTTLQSTPVRKTKIKTEACAHTHEAKLDKS